MKAKQSQQKRSSRIPPAVLSKAVKSANLQNPADKDQVLIEAQHGTSQGPEVGKTGGKLKGKAPAVGRSYESEGYKAAAAVHAADVEAGNSRRDVLIEMGGLFAALGWGPKKGNGKKRPFHPQTESYFAGWKKYRDSLPEGEQRSMNPRISEARRVMAAYIEKGKKAMDEHMQQPGMSYHQLIAALKPRVERAAQTPAGEEKPNVATLAQTKESTERINMVAKLDTGALGEIAAGLTAEQIPVFAHALAIKAAHFKDPLCLKLAQVINTTIAEDAKDQAKKGKK